MDNKQHLDDEEGNKMISDAVESKDLSVGVLVYRYRYTPALHNTLFTNIDASEIDSIIKQSMQ